MSKFILPTIFLGIAFALFFAYINPTFAEVKELRTEQASFDAALRSSKQLQEIRGDLTRTFNSFSTNDIDRLETFLPNSADNIRLIIEIDRLASQYGMVINNVKFDVDADGQQALLPETGSPEAIRDFNVFELEFSTTGRYADFVSFLRDMERSLRTIDIDFISFSTEEAFGVDTFTYDFKIRTYWLK